MTPPAALSAPPATAPTGLYQSSDGVIFCARPACSSAAPDSAPLSTADLVQLERDTGMVPSCRFCGREAAG